MPEGRRFPKKAQSEDRARWARSSFRGLLGEAYSASMRQPSAFSRISVKRR